MSTDREYLAEGAQSYFDCNDEQNPPNGIHNHVNTRTELKSYDPVLYGFLKEIFPCQNKYLKRCDARAGTSLSLFDCSLSLCFIVCLFVCLFAFSQTTLNLLSMSSHKQTTIVILF